MKNEGYRSKKLWTKLKVKKNKENRSTKNIQKIKQLTLAASRVYPRQGEEGPVPRAHEKSR